MASLTSPAIPGFGGEIFAPNTSGYDAKRIQYASSSYREKQILGGTMRPCLIAYPRRGTDDIVAAIRFARDNNKHIVVRSGGHHYCGMSSGDDDTILLSMDDFAYFDVIDVGDKTYARVGVGSRLTNVATAFKAHGVTIPHGECPLVAIGGHAQSGGYGHLLRSFGLALDHVSEFKIYTADGELRTVHRPAVQDKSSLYWGVLGGGPGSFGVLTEVTFDCIRDADHPHSWGSSRFHIYEKELFRRGMEEVKRWTEMLASGDPSLPPDVDMNMSLIDEKFFSKAVYVLEFVNGNGSGRDDQGRNRKFLEKTREDITRAASWWNRYGLPHRGFAGNRPLSFMSDAFVRRRDFTREGREYTLPYKKRYNCSKQPLRADFLDGFVDLVDRVVGSPTVNLVVQVFIGGGAYASPEPSPPLNAICHRDITVGIVFDCFYKPEGESDAVRFQEEMGNLLRLYSGDQEVRMLWGSFGDTDMSNEQVRKYYYDNETWRALQRLKRDVDAGNIFHTEFSVQLGSSMEPSDFVPPERQRDQREHRR